MRKNIKTVTRVHKKIALNKVELINSSFQNLYVAIMKRYNELFEYEDIKVTKSELKSMMGITSKKSEYIQDILEKLTESKFVEINDSKIYGSLFSVKQNKDNTFILSVNEFYREYLFTKKDINLMHTLKTEKKKKYSVADLDYIDNTLKKKKKFLMLIDNESIKKLKGKNNKCIYSMLKEFQGSYIPRGLWQGFSFRKISYNDFKKMLGLKETYRNNNLMKIINKAINDITSLTDLTLSSVETFPVGNRKKEYMIFYFFKKLDSIEKELKKSIDFTNSEKEVIKTEEASADKVSLEKEYSELDKLKFAALKKISKTDFINRAAVLSCTDTNSVFALCKKLKVTDLNNDLFL